MEYVIAEPCIGVKDTACGDACPIGRSRLRERDYDLHRSGRMYRLRRLRASVSGAASFALDDLPEKWADLQK